MTRHSSIVMVLIAMLLVPTYADAGWRKKFSRVVRPVAKAVTRTVTHPRAVVKTVAKSVIVTPTLQTMKKADAIVNGAATIVKDVVKTAPTLPTQIVETARSFDPTYAARKYDEQHQTTPPPRVIQPSSKSRAAEQRAAQSLADRAKRDLAASQRSLQNAQNTAAQLSQRLSNTPRYTTFFGRTISNPSWLILNSRLNNTQRTIANLNASIVVRTMAVNNTQQRLNNLIVGTPYSNPVIGNQNPNQTITPTNSTIISVGSGVIGTLGSFGTASGGGNCNPKFASCS